MFGRCRGGLHADSCQRDGAPVVRKVGVVPGAISARGQPLRCNIQSARPQIQSKSKGLFFLTFALSRGFIEGAYCAYQGPQRPPRGASRPLARHRRAAPGNAPRI